ncbi:MAG: MarR family winged helix-turn-helix transcriptional regulator [Sphingobium sp.]
MGEDDSDVGEIAQRIGYQLRRVDLLAMDALQDEMSRLGVPPGRGTAVAFLYLHPGCDQTELGRVLGINRASTMATVNALVALGVAERRPGRDRRSNALYLTDAGRRLRDDIVRVTADHDEDFFDALTVDERMELFRLLVKVRDSKSAIAPRTNPTTRAILRRVK